MSKTDLQAPRGTRDFYPEDLRLRSWLFDRFREVALRFGFEEIGVGPGEGRQFAATGRLEVVEGAIVAEEPGVTRDINYAVVSSQDHQYRLADSERRKKQGKWIIFIYAELSGNLEDPLQDADESGCVRVFSVTSVHYTEHKLLPMSGAFPRIRY